MASDEQEEGEVGVALVRAFYYIVENHSPHEAFQWLMQVCGVFVHVCTLYLNMYKAIAHVVEH